MPTAAVSPRAPVLPSPLRLLAACVAAVLVALLGLILAGGAAELVGSMYDDGRGLAGIYQALFAAGLVLVATVPATGLALRRVADHGGRVAPGWAWVAGAIGAGLLVPCNAFALGELLTQGASFAAQERVTAIASLGGPPLGLATAWAVLLLWRRRRGPAGATRRRPRPPRPSAPGTAPAPR